jgi:hypothetical protein
MRTRFSRTLAAASILVAVGGCEVFKTNADVLASVNRRALDTPVGAFFDRYGNPASRTPLADGTTEYVWLSRVGYATTGPKELDEHSCRLHLTADQRGRISRVEILYDAPGLKSTSRCREIFDAG